jgi:hypothetical protein
MSDRYQDRAAVMTRTILAAMAQYISSDSVLHNYVINLLRDEIHDIERQIAADREGDNA